VALYQLSYSPEERQATAEHRQLSHPLLNVTAMPAATPTDIGARAEAAVASALVRAGKAVFLPAFGANSRIDLV
jgi:hypothetical protein